MSDQIRIIIPEHHLHYQKYGNGEKTLLTFHGFGQTNKDFYPFHEHLNDEYTIFSFDLFFHGLSTWTNDGIVLNEVHLQSIFFDFFQSNDINGFSVVGYSMGGKFALMLAKLFPDQINQLILVAPDGLHKTIGYRLVTEISAVRSIFHHLIEHPGLFFLFSKILKASGLVNKKLIRFGESQMSTFKLRKKVYLSWTVFRNLFMTKQELTILINNHDIDVLVYLGRHDKLIPPKKITPYFKGISRCDINIIDTGHGELIAQSVYLLKEQK